jgi:hypothetical protein
MKTSVKKQRVFALLVLFGVIFSIPSPGCSKKLSERIQGTWAISQLTCAGKTPGGGISAFNYPSSIVFEASAFSAVSTNGNCITTQRFTPVVYTETGMTISTGTDWTQSYSGTGCASITTYTGKTTSVHEQAIALQSDTAATLTSTADGDVQTFCNGKSPVSLTLTKQ